MSDPSPGHSAPGDQPAPPPLNFAPRGSSDPAIAEAPPDPAGRYYLLASVAALSLFPAVIWGHGFWLLAIVGLAALVVLLAAGIRTDLDGARPARRPARPARAPARTERQPARPATAPARPARSSARAVRQPAQAARQPARAVRQPARAARPPARPARPPARPARGKSPQTALAPRRATPSPPARGEVRVHARQSPGSGAAAPGSADSRLSR
jgi:hypothetical protein